MGAWGEGPFDNDTAADWAYNLQASYDFKAVEKTIVQCLNNPVSWQIDEGIAAAESLAQYLNLDGGNCVYSKDVDSWVLRLKNKKVKPTNKLIEKAIIFITQVLHDKEYLDSWYSQDSKVRALKRTKARLKYL